MHRQLYLCSTGFGGVGITGLTPADVANLTWFQVESDYVRQLIQRSDEVSKANSKLNPVPKGDDELSKPTLADWSEIMRRDHPDWTEQQIADDYADFISKWGE